MSHIEQANGQQLLIYLTNNISSMTDHKIKLAKKISEMRKLFKSMTSESTKASIVLELSKIEKHITPKKNIDRCLGNVWYKLQKLLANGYYSMQCRGNNMSIFQLPSTNLLGVGGFKDLEY